MEPAILSARIASVEERIAAAARRSGRSPEEITLVAVSKGHGPELVAAAFAAGVQNFGENRVEEAGPKVDAVARLLGRLPGGAMQDGGPQWHMIGHLQSRKVAGVISWTHMVHSVDSEKLARRLSRLAAAAGRELPVLLQVNVSGEESKYGFAPEHLAASIADLLALPGLCIQGLMTMAPLTEDPETVRSVFADLRRLRDELAGRFRGRDWPHLSMGMTDDFEVAVEEGSTLVRVGRAIFGERDQHKSNL